jgi:hypothetical protein
VDCTQTISPNGRLHGPESQAGAVNVSAPIGCAWSVSNTNPWVSIVSSLNNSNSGTVTYMVAANHTGSQRICLVNIAGQPFAITQAVDCAMTISPPSVVHGSEIETGTVTVTTMPGCGWSVFNPHSWITILSSPNNSSGTVTYRVIPNLASAARTGFIIVAGQVFTVTQAGRALPPPIDVGHVQVSAVGHSFRSSGGGGTGQSGALESPVSTVADHLIDQNQNSGGGSTLQSVSANWDTNSQFTLTVTAPPGQKFWSTCPPANPRPSRDFSGGNRPVAAPAPEAPWP